jgi:VanZ family protein
MALTLWTIFGLVVWIVLWSIGAKAFDAAMLLVLLVLIGATIEIVKKYLPNRRG